MKLRLILLLALFLAMPALAELPEPDTEAELAAGAVVSMHNAMMRDVLGGDFEFVDIVGREESLMLYSDIDRSAYLLISFDEGTLSRAEMAVLQAYDLDTFKSRAALSLQALALPFLLDEEQAAFFDWLSTQLEAVESAWYAGEDCALNEYEGAYVACAASLYQEDGSALFTLIAHWYTPLSADDVTALMED